MSIWSCLLTVMMTTGVIISKKFKFLKSCLYFTEENDSCVPHLMITSTIIKLRVISGFRPPMAFPLRNLDTSWKPIVKGFQTYTNPNSCICSNIDAVCKPIVKGFQTLPKARRVAYVQIFRYFNEQKNTLTKQGSVQIQTNYVVEYYMVTDKSELMLQIQTKFWQNKGSNKKPGDFITTR